MPWSLQIKTEASLFLRFLKIVLIVQMCFGEKLGQWPAAGQAAEDHEQGCKKPLCQGDCWGEKRLYKESSSHSSVLPCLPDKLRRVSAGINSCLSFTCFALPVKPMCSLMLGPALCPSMVSLSSFADPTTALCWISCLDVIPLPNSFLSRKEM